VSRFQGVDSALNPAMHTRAVKDWSTTPFSISGLVGLAQEPALSPSAESILSIVEGLRVNSAEGLLALKTRCPGPPYRSPVVGAYGIRPYSEEGASARARVAD